MIVGILVSIIVGAICGFAGAGYAVQDDVELGIETDDVILLFLNGGDDLL